MRVRINVMSHRARLVELKRDTAKRFKQVRLSRAMSAAARFQRGSSISTSDLADVLGTGRTFRALRTSARRFHDRLTR